MGMFSGLKELICPLVTTLWEHIMSRTIAKLKQNTREDIEILQQYW
jgi:hypothetical protein